MKKCTCIFLIILFVFPLFYSFSDPALNNPKSKEWKAIIAYFPGAPEEVTEDWVLFLFDLETFFSQDENVYFVGIFSDNDAVVPIVGKKEELIVNIDISEYICDSAGYIFIMKDKDPCWCGSLPTVKVIEKAEHYFYDESEE